MEAGADVCFLNSGIYALSFILPMAKEAKFGENLHSSLEKDACTNAFVLQNVLTQVGVTWFEKKRLQSYPHIPGRMLLLL